MNTKEDAADQKSANVHIRGLEIIDKSAADEEFEKEHPREAKRRGGKNKRAILRRIDHVVLDDLKDGQVNEFNFAIVEPEPSANGNQSACKFSESGEESYR